MTDFFMNQSGGFLYHLRALRYREQLWNPFVCSLESWLLDLKNLPPNILIIGPSGGYTISKKWLERFDQIAISEIDPVGRRIFSARFGTPKIVHDKNFLGTKRQLDPKLLLQIPEYFPQYLVLFANILGQLPLLFENWSSMSETFFNQLRSIPNPIVSYHDLYSFRTGIDLSQEVKQAVIESPNAILEKLNRFAKSEIQVVDHDLLNRVPGMNRKYFLWRLSQHQYQVIEALA